MSGRLEFVLGDLAREEVDAIVNPSNSGFMLSFAGVNGALLEAADEELATECRSLGLAAEGEVRSTGPGKLRCRYVLHAVSPIWHDGTRGEPETLARLHRNIIASALDLDCYSIALPAVGCGAHRFPPEIAAEAAVRAIEEGLAADSTLELVRFVFLSASLRDEYQAVSKRRAMQSEEEPGPYAYWMGAPADAGELLLAMSDDDLLTALRDPESEPRQKTEAELCRLWPDVPADDWRAFLDRLTAQEAHRRGLIETDDLLQRLNPPSP